MKYTTEQLYGIDPKQLANMRYYDALQKVRQGAIAHKERLISSKPLHKLTSEEQAMVTYLEKTIKGREFLIDEME